MLKRIVQKTLLIVCILYATSANAQDPSKSKRKAILLSLAVPGLGQAYTGNWDRARIYFAMEALTWVGFTAFRVYGVWRSDDYRTFAADRAGVTLSGQGDTYFKHIGLFSSSDVFNQDQRLTLREQATIYAGNSTWAWISESDLKQYRSIRKSSQRARVRSYYLTGFAIAVRLASAIDVQRSLPASDYLPSLNLHTPPDGSVWMMAKLTF